ncbi:2-amino-4-hydroxy-6-hydroxymethyldihydropteridine diphosphokinase [Coprothermobacteraceae bacterium]|nr:2-amino-4-hydroxy-6-hydroxymethyldihydropteridine diphosphokinase [Coprothermobacteraceae bacterium]
MAVVYIAFGANLGDREANIKRAQELCSGFIKWDYVSPCIETAPYGRPDQPAFLNAVGRGRTELDPRSLLEKLLQVEKIIGRTRLNRWEPRLIDLDILSYDNLVIKTPELVIPHADLHNRDFLLTILCRHFPEWVHPVFRLNACQLLDRLTTKLPSALGTENLRRVMSALGNPQDWFKSIYVTGSSGKGSVVAMLEAFFKGSVGAFSTPFVCSPEEMVRIGGKPVDLSEYKRIVLATAEEISAKLTPFEVLTGAAYLAFARAGIEWAVVETGIESPMDATNVKHHEVTVVASVGADHLDTLGTAESYMNALLESLGGRIVTLDALPGLEAIPVKSKYELESVNVTFDGTFASVKRLGYIDTAMLGVHQVWNALLAGEAYKEATGQDPDYDLIRSVKIPGRIDVLRRSPLLVVDGGHNEPAFRALADTLSRLNAGSLRVILGMVHGKPIDKALEYLKPMASEMLYFPPYSDRAVTSVDGLRSLDDLFSALEEPVPTLVAGSFYLIGPVLRYFGVCRG